MRRMIVIGIGNRVMKDDGIGVLVAEHLSNKIKNENISVVIGETDFQYCLDEINSDELVIIIDAIYSGKQPGSIMVFEIENAVKYFSNMYSQHDITILNFLKLYCGDLQGYFIGIEISEISYGFDISHALKKKFHNICKQIEDVIMKKGEEIENA